MIKIVAMEFFGGGTLLILSGIYESKSVSSDIFRFVTGLVADKATWMLIGGTLGIAFGLVCLLRASKRS